MPQFSLAQASAGLPRFALRPIQWAALATCAVLVGCGGGGGGGGGEGGGFGADTASQYAQQCAPTNPYAPPALRSGSLNIEKRWLRAYFDDAYLWRDEVPTVDPGLPAFNGPDFYTSIDNYFEALKTPALTSTGARKDRFSFTYPTADWEALSQTGTQAGFGIEWLVLSATPPRRLRIALVEPGSPAAVAGLRRGDTLVAVNGVSVANDATDSGIATINEALAPTETGVPYNLSFSRAGTALPAVTLTSSQITKTPVPLRRVITTPEGARIGYLLFTDHIVTAEAQLIEAINYLRSQNVQDLVLDVRYNGGGYLYIASELAYMIAGPARTTNQVFEHLRYNALRTAETNSPDARTPFFSVSCLPNESFNCTSRLALPTLSLSRVYVLTQPGTCSASESIINGLRGVNVEVRQIGQTTCGKPYGFTARDNCGISYFPIEFKGVNAQGFGDYSDGFTPAGSGMASSTRPPGCVVDDDLSRELGDSSEGLLATALTHRAQGTCPAPALERALASPGSGAPRVLRHPARESRLLAPVR